MNYSIGSFSQFCVLSSTFSLLFLIFNNKMKIPHTFTKLSNTIHKKWYCCLDNDVETSFSYHIFWARVYPFPQMPVYPCKYITISKNAIIAAIQITHSRVIHQNVSTRFLKQEKKNSFPWLLRESMEFNVQTNKNNSSLENLVAKQGQFLLKGVLSRFSRWKVALCNRFSNFKIFCVAWKVSDWYTFSFNQFYGIKIDTAINSNFNLNLNKNLLFLPFHFAKLFTLCYIFRLDQHMAEKWWQIIFAKN